MSTPGAKLLPARTVGIDDYPVDISWSSGSDEFAVGGGEGRLYRVQREAGEPRLVGTHEPGLLSVAWQPRGYTIATAGQDNCVQLWDSRAEAATPQRLHRGMRWPLGLCYRADGQRLAFASGRDLLVFNDESTPVCTLAGHGALLSHAVWRGRDELVVAGNGALFVDRTDEGGKITQYELEGTPATLALSPDMKVAASGLADGTINFRYLNSQKRSRMSGYEGKVDQTAWSTSSRLLATSSSGSSTIVVWDFGGKGPEGSEPQQLEAHEERIESLVWQTGGTHLVSAGRDWRVVLWKPGSTHRTALDIQLLDGPAALARWSADGRHLAVAQPDGKIRLFTLRS